LQIHFLVEAITARSEDTGAATGADELGGIPLGTEGTKTGGVARVSPRSTLGAGAKATFIVDTANLHFFDPDTGLAIWN
ncbi:MAG: ABC transporter ATP-binding protein, partial [Acidimicrobiales bacterium]